MQVKRYSTLMLVTGALLLGAGWSSATAASGDWWQVSKCTTTKDSCVSACSKNTDWTKAALCRDGCYATRKSCEAKSAKSGKKG